MGSRIHGYGTMWRRALAGSCAGVTLTLVWGSASVARTTPGDSARATGSATRLAIGPSLPKVPWEGGPAYWRRFPVTDAAGWDSPSFFPISVFFGKPDHAASLKAIGINTYMGAEHDGSPMSTMTDQGLFVLPQQGEWRLAEVGANPRAVGWFISDECEMGSDGCGGGDEWYGLKIQRQYVAKVDSYHDGRFKHANFGNGILRTYWSVNTMDDHVGLMNTVSADKYTYTSPHNWEIVAQSPDWPDGAVVSTAASYGWQVDQMKRFMSAGALKPIWAFVETARPFLGEPGARTITPNQLEGAVWSSIIHEARGVAFFQHNNNHACGTYSLVECGPALRNKVSAVTAKIRWLAPVINTQSYVWNFRSGTDTMLKFRNGSYYIFAGVKLGGTPGTKTFVLPPGTRGASVTVVGEGRTVPVVGGKFTDRFAYEYTHHVYRVTM